MSLPSFSLSQLGWRPLFAQQIRLDEAGALVPARVIAMHRTVLDTLTEGGELPATLAGSISEQALSASLAVGDWVLVERRTGREVPLGQARRPHQTAAPGPCGPCPADPIDPLGHPHRHEILKRASPDWRYAIGASRGSEGSPIG